MLAVWIMSYLFTFLLGIVLTLVVLYAIGTHSKKKTTAALKEAFELSSQHDKMIVL